MSKIKLLLDVIGDLRSLADSLQAVADAVADNGTAEAELTTTKEPEKVGKVGKAAKNTAKKDARASAFRRAAFWCPSLYGDLEGCLRGYFSKKLFKFFPCTRNGLPDGFNLLPFPSGNFPDGKPLRQHQNPPPLHIR